MAVFQYEGTVGAGEDFTEGGVVRAKDREDATRKLKKLGYRDIHLRKLTGMSAFLKRFVATVK